MNRAIYLIIVFVLFFSVRIFADNKNTTFDYHTSNKLKLFQTQSYSLPSDIEINKKIVINILDNVNIDSTTKIIESLPKIFETKPDKYFNTFNNNNYKHGSLNRRFGALIDGPYNLKANKITGTTGNVALSFIDLKSDKILWKVSVPDAMLEAKVFITEDGKRIALFGVDDYEYEVSEKTAIYVFDDRGNKIVNYNPNGHFRGPIIQSNDGNFIAYLIKSDKYDVSICVLAQKSGIQYEMKDGNININSEMYTINNDGTCLLKTPCDNSKNEIVTIVNPIDARMVFNEKLSINSNFIISASSKYLFIYNSEGCELLDLFNKNIIWEKKGKRTIKQIIYEHQIKAAFSYDETMACIIEKNRVLIIDLLSGTTMGELQGNFFGTPRKPTEAFFIGNEGLFILLSSENKLNVIEFK